MFLNFADLTFPMLLLHFLTFDARWLSASQPQPVTLYFDGKCGFCNAIVRMALAEDLSRRITFAPLYGAYFSEQGIEEPKDDSIVIVDCHDNVAYKSQAVVIVLRSLGRHWRILAWLLEKVPTSMRDLGYDFVGQIRYFMSSNNNQNCMMLPPTYTKQMRG